MHTKKIPSGGFGSLSLPDLRCHAFPEHLFSTRWSSTRPTFYTLVKIQSNTYSVCDINCMCGILQQYLRVYRSPQIDVVSRSVLSRLRSQTPAASCIPRADIVCSPHPPCPRSDCFTFPIAVFPSDRTKTTAQDDRSTQSTGQRRTVDPVLRKQGMIYHVPDLGRNPTLLPADRK